MFVQNTLQPICSTDDERITAQLKNNHQSSYYGWYKNANSISSHRYFKLER